MELNPSSWETKWNKKVDFSEPILKNCKPKENNNIDLFSSKIFFKVEEITLSRREKEKKVIWRQGIEKQEDNWAIWKIQHKDNKVDVSYPYWNKWFSEVEFGLTDF